MYHTLARHQSEFLLSQPESGMGYQIVDAQLKGSHLIIKFIVLNAELAIELNEAAPLYVKQVALEGINRISQKAPVFRWEIIKLYTHDPGTKPVAAISGERVEFPDGAEIFVRRSIYETDKRVDGTSKRLLPGSFTTTLHDSIRYRNSSDDPLIQQAMDHGVRGQWGYYFKPRRNDMLQRGKADPKTGAKEVYFSKGTSNGTLVDRKTLW